MKSRVQSCDQCRKQREKLQEKQCAVCQFEMFSSTTDDIAKAVIAAAVAVFDRRGRTPEYIRKFFDDIIFILEYPEVYGKNLESLEMQKYFTEKYNLDFERVKIKHESQSEFFRRYKIR